MKRVTQIIFALLIVSLTVFQAVAQSPDCAANFNILSTSGLTVSFNNESVYNNPTGTLPATFWNFGDGTTSNDYDVTHTFPAAGTYTVCVSAADLNGNICDTYCETITIMDSGNPCPDLVNIDYIQITDLTYTIGVIGVGSNNSLANLNWTVTNANGFFDSGTSVPFDYTFPGPGLYDVCAVGDIIDANGSLVCSFDNCIQIDVLGSTNACDSYQVVLTTDGTVVVMALAPNDPNLPMPDQVDWILEGGGGMIGSGNPLTYTPNSTGPLEFCAIYSINGVSCPAACAIITLGGPPCDMNIVDDIQGLNGVFSAQTPDGLLFTTTNWVISGGGVSFSGSGNPFTFDFPSAGTYNVCAIGTLVDPVTGVSCTEDGCITVTVSDNNSPCGNYTAVATGFGTTVVMTLAHDGSFPAPDQVTWILEGGGGIIGTGQTLTWTAPGNGTYTLCAEYSVNGAVCPASCTDITLVANPNCEIDFEFDNTPLGNWIFEVLQNNSGAYANIVWTFTDDTGVIVTGTGSPLIFDFPNSGTYTVCVQADLVDSAGNVLCQVSQCYDITIGGTNCPSYSVILNDTGSGAIMMELVSNDPNVPLPANIDWILEGGGGNIGSGNPLTYQTNGAGFYEFCALFDASAPDCPDHACNHITIGGTNDCHMEIGSNITGLIGLFEADNIAGPDFTIVTWTVTGGGAVWTDTGHLFDIAFPGAGTYNICATGELVTPDGQLICEDAQCITVTVSGNTNCPIEYDFDVIDNNLTTVFEVSGNPVTGAIFDDINWEITGPDGSVFTGGGSPFTFVFPNPGTYVVCVEANMVDANGNLICEAHACETIHIEDPNAPCEAFFEGEEFLNSPLPVQNQAIFHNLSSGNYTDVFWDFGDGMFSDSPAPELTHIYSNPGVYNVCLTVSDPDDADCDDTYCALVFITGVTPCNFEVTIATDNSSPQVMSASIASPDGSVPTVAEWYIPTFGAIINIGTGASITYTFTDPGVYTVCVDYEVSGTTCSGTICHEVTINNDDCAVFECVFPGDANYDEVANNFDILNVGLGFGTMGPVRPNASNQWYGQPGPAWTETFDNGVNYKHADCNGDGEIGFGDIEPIMLNYNRTHNGVVPTNFGPSPPIWLEFDLDTIYLNPNSANIQISADVMVGTMALPAQDVYGLAFTVNYPAELVEEGSVQAEYEGSSFLGPSENTLQLEMILPADNVIDFGYSRTDLQNVNGFGTIATTSYVIIDNLIGFAPQVEYEFTLSISDIRVITNTGEELEFAAQSATAIIIVDDQTTSINDPVENEFKIFPNPTNDFINIEYDNASGNEVVIFNSLGQQVAAERLAGKVTTLDVSDYASGIYLVSIHTSEGIVTKRMVVE